MKEDLSDEERRSISKNLRTFIIKGYLALVVGVPVFFASLSFFIHGYIKIVNINTNIVPLLSCVLFFSFCSLGAWYCSKPKYAHCFQQFKVV